MLAAVTRVQELSIDGDEAGLLSRATVDLAACYDVSVSDKAMAWSNFMSVCGMVYGTRLIAIRARIAAEKAERAKASPQPAAPSNVSPMHRPGPQPRQADPNVVDIPGVGSVRVQ